MDIPFRPQNSYCFFPCTAKKQRPKTLESRMVEVSDCKLTEGGFRRSEMNGFSWIFLDSTIFSRLNAGGVYLKLGLVDPAFIQTRHLFGTRCLFIKCIFQPFIFCYHYWRFIELRTQFQQKRFLKNNADRNSD